MNSTTSAIFGKLALHNPSNVVSPSSLPAFVYGTAWKKERSAELVYQALCTGFRAVDTAAQPRHYDEAGVGTGIRRAISEGRVTRHELFVSRLSSFPCCHDSSDLVQAFCPFKHPKQHEPRLDCWKPSLQELSPCLTCLGEKMHKLIDVRCSYKRNSPPFMVRTLKECLTTHHGQ